MKGRPQGYVAALQAFKRFYFEVHGGKDAKDENGARTRKPGKLGRKVHFVIHNVPSQAIAEEKGAWLLHRT